MRMLYEMVKMWINCTSVEITVNTKQYDNDLKSLVEALYCLKKNKDKTLIRKRLEALGFHKVQKGQRPKTGDIVINGNGLVSSHMSENFLRLGVINTAYGAFYLEWVTNPYESGRWNTHAYSKAWFEKAFWIKSAKKQQKESNMKFMVLQTGTWSNWVLDLGSKTYTRNSVFETNEMATDIAKRLAEKYSGYEFFVVKAITSVMKSSIIVTPLSDD